MRKVFSVECPMTMVMNETSGIVVYCQAFISLRLLRNSSISQAFISLRLLFGPFFRLLLLRGPGLLPSQRLGFDLPF